MKNIFQSGKKFVRDSTSILTGQQPSPVRIIEADLTEEATAAAAASPAAAGAPPVDTQTHHELIATIEDLLEEAGGNNRTLNADECATIDIAATRLLREDFFPPEAFEQLTKGLGAVLEFIKETFGARDKIYPTMADVQAVKTYDKKSTSNYPVNENGKAMADIAVVLLVLTNVLQAFERDFGSKLSKKTHFRELAKIVGHCIFTNVEVLKTILFAAGDKLVAPKEGGYEHELVSTLTQLCFTEIGKRVSLKGKVLDMPGALKGKPAPWFPHAPTVRFNTITPARPQAAGRQQQQQQQPSDPNESSPDSISSDASLRTANRQLIKSARKAVKQNQQAAEQNEQAAERYQQVTENQAQALNNNTLATANLTETNKSQQQQLVEKENQLAEARKKCEAERKEKEALQKQVEQLKAQHGDGAGPSKNLAPDNSDPKQTENLAPEFATDNSDNLAPEGAMDNSGNLATEGATDDSDLKPAARGTRKDSAYDLASEAGTQNSTSATTARANKTTTARGQGTTAMAPTKKTTTTTARSKNTNTTTARPKNTNTTTARSKKTTTARGQSTTTVHYPPGTIVIHDKTYKHAVVQEYTAKNVWIYMLETGKRMSVGQDNITAFDRTFHPQLPQQEPHEDVPMELWPQIYR